MKRFREHVLIETVTESATNTEKALCYYHNLRVFEGLADAEESAMQLAQIDGVPQLKKVLMKASIQENNKEAILNSMAAEKVAKLKHTGKTKQKPNEKWLGRDGSFKSDVVEGDEKKRRFSVKSGEARLLGAKRDVTKFKTHLLIFLSYSVFLISLLSHEATIFTLPFFLFLIYKIK